MQRFGKPYESFKAGTKFLVNKVSFILNSAFSHQSIVKRYLHGQGIEIGALHNPLQVPSTVTVRYVDRMSTADLKQQYPELATKNLVPVDIIDDGETLSRIGNDTQDFVIGHQFLEHCQNPIGAIANMLRVLKVGGILYLSVPDQRYTFDRHRPTTDITHLLRDYTEGPAWSKQQHFQEWATFVNLQYTNPQDAAQDHRVAIEADRLMAIDYSIHYHVWTPDAILELLLTLKRSLKFAFELELLLQNRDEVIMVLRKSEGRD